MHKMEYTWLTCYIYYDNEGLNYRTLPNKNVKNKKEKELNTITLSWQIFLECGWVDSCDCPW